MKTSLITACVVLATASVLFSCDWLTGKSSKAKQSFSLEGNWHLDSMAITNDSSKSIGLLALALAQKDSSLQYTFTKDSVFVNQSPSSSYQLNAATKELVLMSDSLPQVYRFASNADTAFTIIDKDSTIFFFKKH
jgi:hypothetical protein